MRDTIKFNLHWKNGTIEGITDGALEADIKKIHETFGQTVVTRAAKNIEKFAKREMTGYYNEYDPIRYKRTDQMHDHSYKSFTDTKTKWYQGGIEIDSSFTKHHSGFPYKDGTYGEPGITEEEIYTNVWDKGFHGYRSTFHMHSGKQWISDLEPIPGTPHRFERVVKSVAAQGFLDQLKNAGLSAVQKQSYSILKFG